MVSLAQRVPVLDTALFGLDLVSARWFGPDAEGIVSDLTSRKREIKTQSEVVRVPPRTATNFFDSAAVTQRVIQRTSQSIGNETQCIQEIALARAIRSHQEHQASQIYLASCNALVVSDGDPMYECLFHALFRF